MSLHYVPYTLDPSEKLIKMIEGIDFIDYPMIDVACGYGRNGLVLLEKGQRCVFCDINREYLRFINESEMFESFRNNKQIKTYPLDVSAKWPFPSNSAGGILLIHYYDERVFYKIKKTVAKGGFVYIETIDNRNDNYLELPYKGLTQKVFFEDFDILYFKEGKERNNRCKVTLFARKVR